MLQPSARRQPVPWESFPDRLSWASLLNSVRCYALAYAALEMTDHREIVRASRSFRAAFARIRSLGSRGRHTGAELQRAGRADAESKCRRTGGGSGGDARPPCGPSGTGRETTTLDRSLSRSPGSIPATSRRTTRASWRRRRSRAEGHGPGHRDSHRQRSQGDWPFLRASSSDMRMAPTACLSSRARSVARSAMTAYRRLSLIPINSQSRASRTGS